MAKFNETIFLNTVSQMNKVSPALVSEPCAKNLLSLAGFQCGYSQSDVIGYIQKVGESLIEGFTDASFDAKGWHSLYSNVVKDDICSELKLTDFGNYKKKTADELESNFNNVISKWYNPSLLKAIFKIDSLHAWTWMLHTILSMAEGKTPEYISVDKLLMIHETKETKKKEKPSKQKTDIISTNDKIPNRKQKSQNNPETCKDKSTSKRVRAHRPIFQYDLNRSLVAEYRSLLDAVDKNPSYKKGTISYCINGHGKTAYGYIWSYEKNFTKKEKLISRQNRTHSSTQAANNKASMLIVYYLDKKKSLDYNREIGRYSSQSEVCQKLGINKSTLCNYLKGRKGSIWCRIKGEKVRIGIVMSPTL